MATTTAAAGSGFTSRIITVAGRRHRRRQGSDGGGKLQCHGDVEPAGAVGHADGDLLGCFRSGADGEQRVTEQWVDGGRHGGDDHRDELCGGRDGDVWQRGGDQRDGGEQHHHHGHDAGRQRGCGDRDGDQPGGQSGSLASGFTYVAPPTVTSVSPNNGPAAGGTAVTITGTNFASGATVTFGSTAATNVTVVNSTTITATTPAGSAGAVTVTVTNSNGQREVWRVDSRMLCRRR